MRFSSIFKSRWMALIWAAGIVWAAYDFAGSTPQPANSASAEQRSDATGEPVTSDDEKKLALELNSF